MEQIKQIANNTKVQIALLEKKYATSDQLKKTCGFIAIFFISFLIGLILLNDFVRLFMYLFLDDEKKVMTNKDSIIVYPQTKPIYIHRKN